MSETVSLKFVDTRLEPNQELVDALKRLLKEAEEGTLRSLFATGHYNNKDIERTAVTDGDNKLLAEGIIGSLYILIKYVDRVYKISEKFISALEGDV